jgi:hypothetical protein
MVLLIYRHRAAFGQPGRGLTAIAQIQFSPQKPTRMMPLACAAGDLWRPQTSACQERRLQSLGAYAAASYVPVLLVMRPKQPFEHDE